MNNKIYLGGPDVFRENAKEHFDLLKRTCSEYGFIGVSPINNLIDESLSKSKKSSLIYKENLKLMSECDIMIMNINPFRGPNVDDGTAFEIGRMSHINLIIGYTNFCNYNLISITNSYNLDHKVYPIIEDFEKPCNLMIYEAIIESGGIIVNEFRLAVRYAAKYFIENTNE